jgi:hypothetical protein
VKQKAAGSTCHQLHEGPTVEHGCLSVERNPVDDGGSCCAGPPLQVHDPASGSLAQPFQSGMAAGKAWSGIYPAAVAARVAGKAPSAARQSLL